MQTATQLLPLLIMSVLLGIIPFYLGVKKGYTWPFLGWAWVPIANMFIILLFVGLPDKNLHKKIDQLLENNHH